MKRLITICAVMGLMLVTNATAQSVILTPVDVSRLYAYADSYQAGAGGGYVYAEWNVLTGPLGSPSASAEYDPIGLPTDGWTLDGLSSFAIARSEMMDAGGWSTLDGIDTFQLFVNNQATGDPGGVPWGWGYSVSYLLITYDTAPTGGSSLGDPMKVTLDVDLGGTLYAGGDYDEYLLDVGYALGTGLSDYDPVVIDPAINPNPGLAQFDNYQSWGSLGYSYIIPTFSDSLEYNGVIGDQVQVLMAVSSFSWCMWGYTWTDGTLDATVTAVAEIPPDNQGPITSNVVADPVPINTSATLTATVDDSTTGNSNIASAEYSLDGGVWTAMAASDGVFDEVSEDVTASFTAPSEPGVYDNLCVRGTDVVSNVGDPACIMLVVYDPTGGFVTGGGWIESEAGAYKPDLSRAGRANFGFVSKYKKGATVPTGNTEFQFKAGDLNFHSSSYQWLVVNQAGSNAQFKGSGTINDAGDYKFMLWAGDGGKGGDDTFCIKIWEEDEFGLEDVVYVNDMDQVIDSGSIIIHTK